MEPVTEAAGASQCTYAVHFPALATSPKELGELIPSLLAFVYSLSAHHIYHNPAQPFTLTVSPQEPYHLIGATDCTDAVDDEWFVVFLLRQISSRWTDAAVSVEDEDGQFLLIEAADELPKWLTPENAGNRVWIYRGDLHLIPLSLDPTESLTLPAALSHLRSSSSLTVAPPQLQAISFLRAVPPSTAHSVTLPLPPKLQAALLSSPQLVAEAIQAFYHRDPDSMKPLNTMTNFPPTPPADMVSTRVTMTRGLWATLKLQKFFPPKPFVKVGGWEDGGEGKIGCAMKLICGFETLYSRTLSTPRILPPHPLTTTPAFCSFVSEVSSPASTPEQLLAFFETASVPPSSLRRSFSQRVDDAASVPVPPTTQDDARKGDDSEEWLSIDVDGLDALLEGRGGGELEDFSDDDEEEDEEEKRAKKAAKRMRDMVGKIEEFVEGKGEVEGAVFKDEESSDEDDSEDDEDEEMVQSRRAARLESLVPPLPSSEWGASTIPEPPPTAVPLSGEGAGAIPSSRPPRFAAENYDGASDSGNSSDEDLEELEDEPALETEGDGDGVEMDEEMEAFLEFATETLGLTKEQYEGILREREGRGAFVPRKSEQTAAQEKGTAPSQKKAAPTAAPRAEMPKEPFRNPDLKDFDALMQQMDAELAAARQNRSSQPATAPAPADSAPKPSTRPKSVDPSAMDLDGVDEDSDEEDESAMHAELANLMSASGGMPGGEGTDYDLVKNFLESFKSQGGFSGPAGSLAGRLGFQLPRSTGDPEE